MSNSIPNDFYYQALSGHGIFFPFPVESHGHVRSDEEKDVSSKCLHALRSALIAASKGASLLKAFVADATFFRRVIAIYADDSERYSLWKLQAVTVNPPNRQLKWLAKLRE